MKNALAIHDFNIGVPGTRRHAYRCVLDAISYGVEIGLNGPTRVRFALELFYIFRLGKPVTWFRLARSQEVELLAARYNRLFETLFKQD